MTPLEILREKITVARAYLTRRQRAYQQTFLLPAVVGHQVLADLAKLCNAHESTFHTDARAHAFAEGQRHVWLHIQRQLHLSEDELWRIYGREKEL